MTVAVTRKEPGAAGLRREAGRCRDAKAARRMLALALVLEGSSRQQAARHAGMDRQTLRDWVHRYNAEGLPGPRDRPRPGRKPRLTPEQEAELATAVERGPDPDRDGVVRWRRVDLRALIETRFAVRLHERTVGKVLRRLGFTRLSVRPRHPKADEAAQEAFKKASPRWWREPCPSMPLAEISDHVAPGAHAVVVLDRAGWHGAGDLVVPENLTLVPLPSYSPELNPVENVWEYLRQNRPSHRVWDGYDAIVAACCAAWNWLVAAPDRLASITRREWAKA